MFKLTVAVLKLLCAISLFVLLMRIDESEISKGARAMSFLAAIFMAVDGFGSYSEYMASRKASR